MMLGRRPTFYRLNEQKEEGIPHDSVVKSICMLLLVFIRRNMILEVPNYSADC